MKEKTNGLNKNPVAMKKRFNKNRGRSGNVRAAEDQTEPTVNEDGVTDEIIKSALIKRATGFVAEETVSEYSFGDGIETLVKRKVTKKDVPPDMTAIKMLMGESPDEDYSSMTDEELLKEKERLIGILKEDEN